MATSNLRPGTIHPDDIRVDIRDYLEGWYIKAKARQESKGKTFNVSFGDFIELWGKRRIRSLTQWMDDGSLHASQRKHTKDDPNLKGYVFAPISFAASREMDVTKSNYQICTRGKSLNDCRMQRGDTHSAASRAAISRKTSGVSKTPEHRAKISGTMTGMKRGPMSEAEKVKRSNAVKVTLAAKRAATLAHNKDQ